MVLKYYCNSEAISSESQPMINFFIEACVLECSYIKVTLSQRLKTELKIVKLFQTLKWKKKKKQFFKIFTKFWSESFEVECIFVLVVVGPSRTYTSTSYELCNDCLWWTIIHINIIWFVMVYLVMSVSLVNTASPSPLWYSLMWFNSHYMPGVLLIIK